MLRMGESSLIMEKRQHSYWIRQLLPMEEYRNRLGCSQTTTMRFNLSDLLVNHNLDHINEPFTKEQIDTVVSHMPLDKAPGPDGFNGKFI
jgi:hypothetical protein